jgi:hypothetical protein
MSQRVRVFATCDIGDALNILRSKGYDLEVYPKPEAPPKSLIIDKVKSGIDGLITTLRDSIDAEVFAAGKDTLRVVAPIASDSTISTAPTPTVSGPVHHTADVHNQATAEFAFLIGALARKMWPPTPAARQPLGLLASVPAVSGR